MKYNKLVRDNIPKIIRTNGEQPNTRTLSHSEYKAELYKKLQEEVGELLEAKNLEELADVQEVINAICIAQGTTLDELEVERASKCAKRGGFEKRIYLVSTEKPKSN